mgnify:CR=1 FL=1
MIKPMILTLGVLLGLSFSLTGHVIAQTQFQTVTDCDRVEAGQLAALGCALFVTNSSQVEPGSRSADQSVSAPAVADIPSSGTQALVFLPVLSRSPAPEATLAQQVLDQTNYYRAQNGCGPLVLQPALTTAAQRHSDDMASHNFFSHTGSDGSNFASRLLQAGYYFSQAAENIGAGYATPEDVVEGWMNSPGHRANILNCNLTELGVGYSESSTSQYTRYWTQNMGTCQ